MDKSISDIINLSKIFWGQGGYLTLFLISILLVCFVLKNREAKEMFGWYSALILILIYNPIFFWVSALWLSGSIVTWKDYIAQGSLNYVRIFYALPVTFLIAFVIIEMVCRIKRIWKKVVWIAVGIIIFLSMARNVYCNGHYTAADNWYKIPEDTITVCEIMKQTAEPEEKIKALITNDLIVYIRQYEARITMPYGREAMTGELPTAFSNGTLAGEELDSWLAEIDCNYIVCNLHMNMLSVLQEKGYVIVGQAENHMILKRQ